MMIQCEECGLPITDKALFCPHCGNPRSEDVVKKIKKKTRKRRRLPNGFGQIYQIKDQRLRKPFRVRVCVGKNQFGQPILKNLKPECYFKTYNEAYAALVDYNRNPYDLDDSITIRELYEKWSEKYFAEISDSSARTITSAWTYCWSVYDMRAKDIRARHIKGCMDEGYRIETRGAKKGEKIYASASTKSRIKSLFNLMLDYAYEYEIVDKNYARTFDVPDAIVKEQEETKRAHINFTEEEMKILWENVGKVKFVDWVLIQCYMGWRPQEIATIRLDEININEWYMEAGMKTDSGKQRIVPIHEKIKGLVKKNYDFALSINSEYFLNDKGQTHSGRWKLTYDKYSSRFEKVIGELKLNPDHRAHDPRLTFVTRCKKANVDEYALKHMVGHRIKDITESTYTVRDVEWLRSDLEKMQ